MQTARILQAVVLMMIIAFAASCATTNQYVSKLFNNRSVPIRDTQSFVIKFLELDNLEADKQSWVKTDIIKVKDSTIGDKTIPVVAEAKTSPIPDEPVVRTNNPDGTRSKRMRE
ncbi:MAG: hypothetical protein JJE22_15530 [Bacteroidia bacterium]|nr:hypothetical protein [Bacteroidia bacterium]